MNNSPLKSLKRYPALILLFTSFIIVSYGQPASIPGLSAISALLGYALMARVLLDIPSAIKRFCLGSVWFIAVQAVQLSWFFSHPYNYIYFVHAGFSILWGVQWGLLAIFITPERLKKMTHVIFLTSFWTLLEWSRLFFLSGYTWNPAGIALTENIYAMQLASIGGIFALSFWVLLVNMMGLRAWLLLPKKIPALTWITLATLPYVYGALHVYIHDANDKQQQLVHKKEPYRALLVQTAFPAEETLIFNDKPSYIAYVLDEWNQIFKILHPFREKEVDLIALPEYVVPFGTYTYLYPHEHVKNLIIGTFGESATDKLPPLDEPFARSYPTNQGNVWFVNNAFWSQAIANIFQSEVIVGLEDVTQNENAKREHYSAAIHFLPNSTLANFSTQRYAKRVLLPMAEYIPFSIFHSLAALYGIQGSLTFGTEATVFNGINMPFGVSICYEETFGNMMRECRLNGAELLVNLTSDVWYPNSKLPKQHFDHARLRSIENGIPIVRACNTGITSACDSLGRIIAMLGDTTPESQWIADALYVEVPKYHYKTLYSHFGDLSILLLCCFGILLRVIYNKI